MFRAYQFFHKLVGFLAVVFFQDFFNTLALFFDLCLLCFSCALFNLLVGFSIKFCTFSRILLLFQFSPFVTQLKYVICDPTRLGWSVFAKDVVGCFCHGSIKAVDQGIYFRVLIFKGEEWSKLSSHCCSKYFCDVGVLEFLQTEPDAYFALGCHPLEAESEGHHYMLMITPNIRYLKAPGLCSAHT